MIQGHTIAAFSRERSVEHLKRNQAMERRYPILANLRARIVKSILAAVADTSCVSPDETKQQPDE